jgi:hypothetical protein
LIWLIFINNAFQSNNPLILSTLWTTYSWENIFLRNFILASRYALRSWLTMLPIPNLESVLNWDQSLVIRDSISTLMMKIEERFNILIIFWLPLNYGPSRYKIYYLWLDDVFLLVWRKRIFQIELIHMCVLKFFFWYWFHSGEWKDDFMKLIEINVDYFIEQFSIFSKYRFSIEVFD